jgi:hypothetical protein
MEAVRECKILRFQRINRNGRGDPAPTLTMRIQGTFGTVWDLFIYVKVGARFPRPHPVGVFSGSLPGDNPGDRIIFS